MASKGAGSLGATTLELDTIYNQVTKFKRDREQKRRQAPLVRLWDGDWNLRGRLTGEYSGEFEFLLNDTGAGHVEIPADHHLAQWVFKYWERGKANVFITVDSAGARWSGMLDSSTVEKTDDGYLVCTLKFLHDFEQLKHILVWANPFTPSVVQFPRSFVLAGPSVYCLKTALFLNLKRIQGNLWSLPDDPLSFNGWKQGLNYKEWPILVKPQSLSGDGSQWTVINSRFKTWFDMAESTLGDGQLYVECRRWLPGDPQPWQGADLYRAGQLIIDIKDKSGVWDLTSTGGNLFSGLLRTIIQIADDLIDETRVHTGRADNAPEYTIANYLGTNPKQPWAVYRTDDKVNTAESTEFTWQPATVSQVVVGGKSMPGVNEGISAAVQLMFNTLSTYLFLPSLGGPVDTLLRPIYEDTIMAFMNIKSTKRTTSLGWSHYRERFQDGGDQAWTLSAILALRNGFWETRERTSHSMKVGDGAPYLIGDQGEGHLFLGDRVGGQIPGSKEGTVVVDQVSSLKLAWDAETPHEWEITVGDPNAIDDPLNHALGKIKDAFAALHDLGVT